MSTPIKVVSSLLRTPKLLSPTSPQLLSPWQNPVQYPHTKKKAKDVTHIKEVTKSRIQITLSRSDDSALEQSLLIDSPHKHNILNHGLNKYDLLYIIGRGSFGTVVKATYKGRLVAAKLLKVDQSSSQMGEINARHFDHDNIVKIFDIVFGSKYALVVMEYFKNCKNLQYILDDFAFIMNRKTIIKFGQDIAVGLKYCHQRHILHLDIKPKNILLCNNTCKICDFGNSVSVHDAACSWKFTGTVAYAAPEILQGKVPTAKSDIYSFGILLWQLIFRKYPFEFIDNHVVIYKVVKFKLRPSWDIIQNFEDLHDLSCACWEEDPKDRPEAGSICDILNNLK